MYILNIACIYCDGTISDEIFKEMVPEIIEQYYLWDEVAKKEVERYPLFILDWCMESGASRKQLL